MNKSLYRIVFNDARGQLMVVAETATGDGKSATGRRPGKRLTAPYWATLRALSFSLFVAQGMVFSSAHAQIVAYKAAPGNQQPIVLNAGNGVPLVNIQTPSAAGVSRNSYGQFDVQPAGAILNNARTNTQTLLGGWVQGNPWLATGTARVIVNEVFSANPSLLHGYVEVAGSNAQVVIANPAGVSCAGCGFINANRATLTTGALVMSGGSLDGYRVANGTIRIEGAGLDASRVDYTDLIARAVEVNAGVWAKDLRVTAGANQVDAANIQATPISGNGAAPAFAIDVARLGGMYANKIALVGTEAGVGVRNAGTVGGAAGEVVVTADGKLVNQGTLISGDQPLTVSTRGIANAGTVSSDGNLTLASVGDVVNSGLIHAGRELSLDSAGQLANHQGTLEGQRLAINAERLVNDGGTLRQNGAQALAVSAGQVGNAAGALIGNVAPTGGGNGGSASTPAVSAGIAAATTTSSDGVIAVVPATTARLADGLIKVRGAIDNAGTIAASGAVSLTAGAGLINAGTLTLSRLDAGGESVQSIRNSGAIAATSARLAAPLLDNRGGTLLVADKLDLATHDIVNAQGTIRHSGADALTVAPTGNLDNRSGQIASTGIDLKVSAAAVDNTGGRIEHAGDGALNLATNRLDGNGGHIESRGALVVAAAAEAMFDGASTLGRSFAISAATLSNKGGSIAQTGRSSSSVAVTNRFDNSAGSVASSGSVKIAAGEIDNRGGGKIATNGDLALNTTTGALANDGGVINSQGHIDAKIVGELGNASGQIVANTDLALTTGGRVNNGGGTLGAVAGRLDATVGGVLNSSGGRVEAATALTLSSKGLNNVDGTLIGQSITIDSRQQSFDNSRGTVAAGGTLNVASGTLSNAAGRLQAAGALTVDSHGQTIANTNGGNILGQSSVALTAGALDNSSGVIGAAETLTLNADSLTNRAGRITQNGTVSGPITVAGQFDNAGGTLASAATLNLTAGEIDNRGSGKIAANGDLTLTTTTGALINDAGTINSLGRFVANVAGELGNASGQLVAGIDLTLTTGGRVINTGGTLGAVAGSLDATVGGALDNGGGRVEAATALTLASNGLSNAGGTLIGQSVAIDSRQLAFDNTRGTVAAGSTLAVSSGTLTNAAGRLQAVGALTIDSHGQTIANTGGGTILGQSSVALSAGAIDNTAGVIGAANSLTLNAASLTNRAGRITQNGTVSGPIAVAGRFDNTGGTLASAAALNLTAGEIDNRGGGKIATNADLALTTIGSLTNDGGTVNSQGRIDAKIAGELSNASGQIVANTDLSLTTGGRVINTGGTLGAVAGSLGATVGSVFDNTGGRIEAATSLALSSNGLSNVGGTILGQSLVIDGRQQSFDNTRGTVAAGGTLNVTSGTLTNAAGRLQAAGALTVDSHGQTIANIGGGTILGQSSIALTAGALDNSSGVIGAAETLTLNAASLTNRAGRITQNGTVSGPITVAGRLDNTGGTLASAAALSLTAGEIDNRGGGKIASNGDLTPTTTTGALANDGGTVNSLGRIDAHIAGELGNTSGQLVAGTDLKLTTGGRANNAGGTLGAVAGRLDATVGGALDNGGGRVEAATALTLASNGLGNVGGTILSQSIAIDGRQQSFDNTLGTVAAGSMLAVSSGTLSNAAGRLQAAGALTIDSHGQTIANTNGGSILGQTSVALSAGALDNSSGLIASAETLNLTASRLANLGGRLSAQNGITLASGATLDNRSGDIQSGGDLSATASTIDNGGGLMRAAGTLSIGADRLVNTGTNADDQGLEGRSLIVEANMIDNRSGALRASDALTIDSAGTLDNSSGLISSTRTLALRDANPVRTLSVTNSGGTIIAGTDLAIRANRLSGDGRILSHGDLAVDLAADFTNTSEITADRNASLVTAGALSNSGIVQAGNTLAVQAASLDNTAAGKIAGGTLQIRAMGTLTNRGLIDGGDAFINASSVDNLGSGRLYGNHLAIAAATVNNRPESSVAPVIAARERLDIGTWAIDNRDGALLFSAGDLAIGGVLDARHRAAGQAAAITNASATIEALGNLAIDTASLVNRKTSFATTRITSGTPEVGIALLDYTPELEFHWPFFKTGTAPWRSLILEKYLNTIDKLLGGGPGAALVADYNVRPTPGDPDNPPLAQTHDKEIFVNVWGDLKDYTGPIGGGLDEAYRSRLAAAVNAPAPMEFADSHKIWQLLIDTIAAEHPEYIDRMIQSLAARGPLQFAYRQICVDTDDCAYVYDVVSTSISQRDVVSADSPAAVIRAGGNATINSSALENRYSVIQSGGDMALTGATLTNIGAELYLVTDTTSTSRLWHWQNRDHGATTSASSTQTLIGSAPAIISAGGALTGRYSDRIDNIAIRQNAARVVGQSGNTPEATGRAGIGTNAVGAGSAQTTSGAGESVASTAHTGVAQTASGSGESVASSARAGVAQTASSTGQSVSSTARSSSANTASTFGTAPARITRVAAAGAASGPNIVVATAALALTLPASRLMYVNPDPAVHYLVETDPAFANYRSWLSSDYLLGALKLDPATTQKRLGDGFYEQRLILEQVAQLTGRRFLSGYSSDEAQYRALMAAGATVAQEWGLVPGVALSAAQMARLTTDIVWLVEREVTLADGTTAKVLVPQVYASVRDGDLDASGALIAGNDVQLATAGDLVTSGTIAGRRVVALTAENIADLRGRIAGRDVAVQAANDLTVLGGSIEAERTLLAGAGNNLTVASTTVDRDYRNNSTGTANSVKQTTIDRVAGLYVTGPGGTLVASAGNDLGLLAAVVSNATAVGGDGGAGATLLAAGNDLILGTVTEASHSVTSSKKTKRTEDSSTEIGSTIQSTGDIVMQAGNDFTARAASVTSVDGALGVSAANNLRIESGESSYAMEYNRKSKKSGLLGSSTKVRRDSVNTTTALASTFSGDTVALKAGQDIAIKGSNVMATGDLSLAAARDLIVETAQETANESHFRSETKSGFSASFSGGISYGKISLEQSAAGQRVTQVASTLSGGDIALASGRDTTISASNVLADRDLTILAGRNVDILAVANSEAVQNRSKSESTSIGLTPSLTGRFTAYGKTSASEDGTGSGATQSTSLLSANSGDLTVRAGLDEATRGTGTGNIVTQGADLLAGEAITLSGRAIDLQAVSNETRSHTVAKSSSLTVGSALAGPLGSKITAIGDAIEQAQHTDNSRLQGALVLKAGYDAYKLTQGKDVTSVDATGTTEATTQAAQAAQLAKDAQIEKARELAGSAGAASASSGIGISVSIGSSKSSSESSTHETQVIGTNLQAKRIDITATETDIAMAAAKLQAETIGLTAKRDVILEAAANTSELASSNKGSSVGAGVTLAFGGQQSGLSFQLNASRSQGKANGNETTWDNTRISATDRLSVTSGRDTTLKGAQVAGGTVVFDVGGKLLVETLQDSSKYDSKQSSSGFSVSLCIPPLCGGVAVTGNVSASEQSIKHSYLSAVGQSGIAAGDGGFDIRVKGTTELVGAAITSSAAASDNRLTTASLSSRDLQNAQSTQSRGSSVSIGYGGGSLLTTLAGNAAQNVQGNLQSNAALTQNGSQSGTTQSVISPATITITGSGDVAQDASSRQTAEQLTARDAATANGSLTNTLTLQQAQALQADVARQQENMEAAKLVGAVLSNMVGDLAKDKWADGSPQKLALHGMVGLIEAKIGGGSAAAGALSAMSQEAMAPILADYLQKKGIAVGSDDYKSLLQLGATLTGAAVGTLAGGDVKGASTGANAAFVGVTNNTTYHYKGKIIAYDKNNNDNIIELSDQDLPKLAAQNPEILLQFVAGIGKQEAPIILLDTSSNLMTKSSILDLKNPNDNSQIAKESGMGYKNLTDQATHIYVQTGMDTTPSGAEQNATDLSRLLGQPVGYINNGTEGLAGDLGEYLPDTINKKDVLNEYTLRTLNSKGPTLIVIHSAGNEDLRKALLVGALYGHKYENLSFLSIGSPVGDNALQTIIGQGGAQYLRQVNDWRDPITYSKTAGVVSVASFLGGMGYGAIQGCSAGASAMLLGCFFAGGAGATAGAAIGGIPFVAAYLGLKSYHPFEQYLAKPQTQTILFDWLKANPLAPTGQ